MNVNIAKGYEKRVKKPTKIKKGIDSQILSLMSYLVTGTIGLLCLIPFIMVISASFS